jgi:hypothetical protein
MKKVWMFFFVFVINKAVHCQEAPIKWGQISIAELEKKEYEGFANAPAVILCDYGEVYFENFIDQLRLFYQRHVRIKVLTKEGARYAKAELTYLSWNEYERPCKFKAQILSTDKNGKVNIKKISRKLIKEEIIDAHHRRITAEVPDIEPGSVFEYSYTLVSSDFVNWKDWNFQTNIPTLYSEFRSKVPEMFNYMFAISGQKFLTDNESKDAFMSYQWINRLDPTIISITEIPFGGYPYRGYLSVYGRAYRFVAQNLPSLSEFNYTSNCDECKAKIKIHLVKATYPRTNSIYQNNSWQLFSRTLILTTFSYHIR